MVPSHRDVCFCFAGADGSEAHVECSSESLKLASPLLRELLSPENRSLLSTKRNAAGLTLLTMTNPRLHAQAVADALHFIHLHTPPPPPRRASAAASAVSAASPCASAAAAAASALPFPREVAMLSPLDWLDALHSWQPARQFATSLMAQVPDIIRGMAGRADEALRFITDLGDLPQAALDAASPDSVRRLLYFATADKPLPQALDIVCDVLALFGRAADVTHKLLCWDILPVLNWLSSTTRPLEHAVRLVLLRAPPILVARHLLVRGPLTEELYDLVVTANMDRMTLPDFAALACFTPLAEQRSPDLVRMAGAQQNTAVDAPGGVISIKMRTDNVASKATLRHGDVVIKAVGEDAVGVTVLRTCCMSSFEMFVLADRSSTVFTSTRADRGASLSVPLVRGQQHNTLGAGNRYVLLVPYMYCKFITH